MNDITTTLYQYLANKFSQLDWTTGSVLRELIAAPLAALSEQAVVAVNDVYNSRNIVTLLTDPEGNADTIAKLFTELGLDIPSQKQSQGTVKILVQSPETFSVPAGAGFSYNDTLLYVTRNYNVTLIPTLASDIQLSQIGYQAYQAIIPVTADISGGSIGTGAELGWFGIGASIYSATVDSPITGGVGVYTATQKLNKIRQLLFPTGISCGESLLRTINSYAGETATDCWLGGKNPFGRGQIYVKPTSLYEYWNVDVATNGEKTAIIPGVGIYTIVSINGSSSNFTVERSGRNLVVTSTANLPAKITARVFGNRLLSTAQDALDNYTKNTGVTLDVLPPRMLYLEMYLPVQAPGASALSEICNAVNGSTINTTTLGDITTRPIFESYGTSMPGTGKYILKDPLTSESYGGDATINPALFVSTDTPYAIYTSIDRIATNG